MSLWKREWEPVNFSDLVGKTVRAIFNAKEGSEEIVFKCSDGSIYKMYHEQDCCEGVWLESIDGDIMNLVNTPIVMAEVVSETSEEENCTPPCEDWCDSWTWTFYKLATAKGYVTLRWFGSSNGYYSEEVDFCKWNGVDVRG